jgi:hypothetical protein
MSTTVNQLTKELMMETAQVLTLQAVPTAERELTLNDRCDSCSAAAMVVATLLNGELMFCGHHAKKLSNTLMKKALDVYDPQKVLTL